MARGPKRRQRTMKILWRRCVVNGKTGKVKVINDENQYINLLTFELILIFT